MRGNFRIRMGLTKKETFILILLFFLTALLWQNMLVYDGTVYWTGWKYIWADWTIHIPYTLNIAYRPFPLLTHPQLSGLPFRYHFAADLISGMLMKTGIPLIPAMIIPSILSLWATILALVLWYRTIWKNKRTAWIALALFLCNGGLGIIWVSLAKLHLIPALGVQKDLIQYTKLDQFGIVWENFITAELIPQRPFLLGLPITLLLITFIFRSTESNAFPSRKKLLLAGIVAGILPLVHIYSFTVFLIYSVYIILIHSRKNILHWFWFFLPVIVGSFGIIYGIYHGLGTHSITFAPGWLSPPGILPFIWFWFNNLGIMAIMIPIAWIFSEQKYRTATLPLMLLFVIANIFVFQEVTWDNRKYFLYWYIAAAGFVAHFLQKLFNSASSIRKILATLLLYLAIISGTIDILSLFRFHEQKYPLFTRDTYVFAEKLRSQIPVDAVVLTDPSNTFLGLVLGRQIVLGFVPWLENHGFEVTEREKDSISIYKGSPDAKNLLRKYSVDYVIIGEKEKNLMTYDWFADTFPLLLSSGNAKVYKVR